MNINEIKAKLGVSSIDFSRNMIPDPAAPGQMKPTEWLKAWDNTARISIVAHQDVILAAKEGSTSLIVKTQTLRTRKPGEAKGQGTGAEYLQHTICVAKSIEVSL